MDCKGTPPKFNMVHLKMMGSKKGISISRDFFSGSMLNFRGVYTNHFQLKMFPFPDRNSFCLEGQVIQVRLLCVTLSHYGSILTGKIHISWTLKTWRLWFRHFVHLDLGWFFQLPAGKKCQKLQFGHSIFPRSTSSSVFLFFSTTNSLSIFCLGEITWNSPSSNP